MTPPRHTWGPFLCILHDMYVCLLIIKLEGQELLRASCLKLEIKEFRCYEAKIEESEKRPAATGQSEKTTQHGFFPGGENFLVDP